MSEDAPKRVSLAQKGRDLYAWAAKRKVGLLVTLVPILLVFVLTFLLENILDRQWLQRLETCFQFLTGNWPSGGLDHRGLTFAAGVTFKFALVYTALAGLVKVWRDLVAWKAQETIEATVMKYSELLRDRDDSIESQVLGLIPDNVPPETREQVRKSIHEAFQEGAKLWAHQYLPVLVGTDNADRILKRLERENVIS